MKKEEEARASTSDRGQDQHFRTLFEHLESTSEAVVGLEYITEYHSGNPSDDPLYHCGLEACEDAQGDAEFMRDHILSNRHRQSFLEIKTGSFLKHQTEIQQAVAEFTKDYRRDYREMKEVTDKRVWNDIRSQRLKTHKSPERSRSSPSRRVKPESRDDYYHHDDRERRNDYNRERRRSRSPRRSRSRSSRRHRSRSPRRSRSRSQRRVKRESDYYDNSRSRHTSDRARNQESSSDNNPRRDRDRYRDCDRVKNEVYDDDDGIEEVTRSGNFENWRTATINIKTRDDEQRSSASQSLHYGANEEPAASSMEEDVKRLHNRVAKIVMENINKFYPGAPEFQPHLHKIENGDAYSRIARELSYELRGKIKESYQAYHDGDLTGVRVTPDNIAFIEQEIERYFEPIPVIKERRYY